MRQKKTKTLISVVMKINIVISVFFSFIVIIIFLKLILSYQIDLVQGHKSLYIAWTIQGFITAFGQCHIPHNYIAITLNY